MLAPARDAAQDEALIKRAVEKTRYFNSCIRVLVSITRFIEANANEHRSGGTRRCGTRLIIVLPVTGVVYRRLR